MSNLSFSHSVFKRLVLKTSENHETVREGKKTLWENDNFLFPLRFQERSKGCGSMELCNMGINSPNDL